MEITQNGPEDGPPVVLVMGWGNKLHHENVTWLSALFAEAGYRVHTFQIPVTISDFEAEYLEPVEEYVEEFEQFRLVGHSTGGLIAPFLDGGITRTYLSPWWGFPQGPVGADDTLLGLFSKLPTSREIIPSGESSAEDIGELATEQQLAEGPTKVAPTFLREIRRAHRERPPIDDDAVVFCTPADSIVSVRAIADAVSFDQLVFYEGEHELFSSRNREAYRETLLEAVEDGEKKSTDSIR
jgi:hypothetical protein